MKELSLKKKVVIIRKYLITQELQDKAKDDSRMKKIFWGLILLSNWRSMIGVLNNSYLILNYVEMVITTKCSLQCRDCGNLIQYYDNPYHVSREINLSAIDKTKAEVIQQYKNCNPLCKSFINGKLHHCPRSSNGMDLGIVSENKKDFIDFLDKNVPREEKRRRLMEFLYGNSNLFVEACYYCDKGTKNIKKVKPGIQK